MTSEFIVGSVNTNPVVRRILTMLSKAGLVDTQEGAGGGVRLVKPAADIDLRAVYAAVEADSLFDLHPPPAGPEAALLGRGDHPGGPVPDPRRGRGGNARLARQDHGGRPAQSGPSVTPSGAER